MKNHNEMYQSLLYRYNEHQEKKNKRILMIKFIVPILTCLSLIMMLGVEYYNNYKNHPPTVTKETAEKINTPVQQTKPFVSSTDSSVQIESTENEYNHDVSRQREMAYSSIEWNGITYYDSDKTNISVYTKDKYIGKVGDFKGNYNSDFKYPISPEDNVYTVKETIDVLLVVKAKANSYYEDIIIMCSSNLLYEEYESEGNESDYTESTDDSISTTILFDRVYQ